MDAPFPFPFGAAALAEVTGVVSASLGVADLIHVGEFYEGRKANPRASDRRHRG